METRHELQPVRWGHFHGRSLFCAESGGRGVEQDRARTRDATTCLAPWAASVVQNELENTRHGCPVGLTEIETGENEPGITQRQLIAFSRSKRDPPGSRVYSLLTACPRPFCGRRPSPEPPLRGCDATVLGAGGGTVHYLFFLSCSSSSTASVLSLFAQILQVVPPNAAWPDALWEDDFWEKDFWEKDF